MNKNRGKVYLGYEDEVLSEKSKQFLSYTLNKIGGLPDWPPGENLEFASKCPLCDLHRVLVVQCYAPLEHSVYHRTLYVFACINPSCWVKSEGWLCIRSQYQEPIQETTVTAPADPGMAWCSGADEWDEDDGDIQNGNELDANVIVKNGAQRVSDDEDSSESMCEMDSLGRTLTALDVDDEDVATTPDQGPLYPAAAAAEGPAPTEDLRALMEEASCLPAPLRCRLRAAPAQFRAAFLYVEEARAAGGAGAGGGGCGDVTRLLDKYRREGGAEAGGGAEGAGDAAEAYEQAAPAHGDTMFHAFVTRLRDHPGAVLRYTLDEPPWLGAPLPREAAAACARCAAPLRCELQLLPALAAALRLHPPSETGEVALHFLSVLVYTCAASCGRGESVAETVLMQPEV